MATSDAPLNVPNVTLAVARGTSSGGGGGTSPEPTLVYDGFESADMSAPDGPAPAKNTSGFTWDSNNRTSVVTNNEDGNIAVYNNGEIYNESTDPNSDFTAKTGDYSLRFNYPADTAWTEQEFNLGGSYPEIWFRYWIRVPSNFVHGTDAPNNNKFFALYMDDYSTAGEGATVTLEFWRTDSNGSSHITVNRSGGSGNQGHSDPAPFIQVPEDRGRWMEVVIQAVASSSNTTYDGEIRFWRRWESDASFTLIHELTGELFPVPTEGDASNGWHQGYLMGYANATYSEVTEWLIDAFKLSETSLLEV